MSASALASEAQAKMIAWLWAGPKRYMNSVGALDPNATIGACIRHGWLVGTGSKGNYPNGTEFEMYELSPAGLAALAQFARKHFV